MAQKNTVYIYYKSVFQKNYRCNLCQNHDKLYKLYKYNIQELSKNNVYHNNKSQQSNK